jgi:uncharacterized membrane protein YkvI
VKKDHIVIFQIAATYIGTIVGAGFATGREIVEFFTKYGSIGIIGIGISGFLFIWLGTKIMLLANQIRAYSLQEFNEYLFGKTFGTMVNSLFILILFGVTSVMFAGVGAVFEEQLGISKFVGLILTVCLCYIVISRGFNGIFFINSLIVPVMVLFSFSIAMTLLGQSESSTFFRFSAGSTSEWKWLASSLTYVGFNLTLAQVILVPLGREISNVKVIKWGGFFGGLGLCFILITNHIALLSLPNVLSYEIPMAQIVQSFGQSIHILFVIVIFGEILTTVISNVFGLARQINTATALSEKKVIIAVLLLCTLVGQIGFGTLLSFLYPLFGCVGLFSLIYIMFKRLQ